MYQIFSFRCLLLLNISLALAAFSRCSFQRSTVIPPSVSATQSFSLNLLQWNKQQKVKLQPHQLAVIDFLEKNSVKGTIVNHYLGTGKTYTAIGYAERVSDRPIIIMAPHYLEYHWLEHLEKYGVKDKSRYHFFADTAPETLLKRNLSNSVIIIDESHRFVSNTRSSQPHYSDLYKEIQSAYRVLSLTGTPIYEDIYDFIYQVNLVAGKTILSFNHHNFDRDMFVINPWKSLFRGYLANTFLNHQLMLQSIISLPLHFYINDYLMIKLSDEANSNVVTNPHKIVNGIISIFAPLSPFLMTFLLNRIVTNKPILKFSLRELNLIKMRKITKKYVSYYDFSKNENAYPTRHFLRKNLSYNDAQVNFLYKFLDNDLNHFELKQILKDTHYSRLSQNFTQLNISQLQEKYGAQAGAGREFGNFSFIGKASPDPIKNTISITRPEKFEQILKTIEKSTGPTVVYSHYYHNGLLMFKQFLDAKGYQNQYEILHPKYTLEDYTRIVGQFNAGKVKILLLHPNITEGISLKGTRQLHFLEIPINTACQKQIVGRVVRYRSHTHLPKPEQYVQIYYWCYRIAVFDLRAYFLKRKIWHYRFNESYHVPITRGRNLLDKKALEKNMSPDIEAYKLLHTLDRYTSLFIQHLKTYSIESNYRCL